ncbi:MAG: hypothetical protein PHY23_00730 [Oscillospiraceae bacterium]|jgi:hypothetical protein|nr:hypothetical protein [Oscillospiraceae bacterium]
MIVKITNGVITTKVTKGAFDSMYAKQGFTIVENIEETEDDSEQED